MFLMCLIGIFALGISINIYVFKTDSVIISGIIKTISVIFVIVAIIVLLPFIIATYFDEICKKTTITIN